MRCAAKDRDSLHEDPSAEVKISLTRRPFRGTRKACVQLVEVHGMQDSRWYRCLGFGHMAAQCGGPDKSRCCWRCGVEGHCGCLHEKTAVLPLRRARTKTPDWSSSGDHQVCSYNLGNCAHRQWPRSNANAVPRPLSGLCKIKIVQKHFCLSLLFSHLLPSVEWPLIDLTRSNCWFFHTSWTHFFEYKKWYIFLNNPFFITSDNSFQKRIEFIAFKMPITSVDAFCSINFFQFMWNPNIKFLNESKTFYMTVDCWFWYF